MTASRSEARSKAGNPLLITVLLLLTAVPAFAQQAPVGDIFSSGTGTNSNTGNNSNTYSDQFSSSCEKGNTSPFAAMDPLSCHGVMMPTDSRGQCSGARGWQLLHQEGNSCYFCQPLNPPINGIIIPIDQLNEARNQGYKCGVDQADVNCKAICTRVSGAGPYTPPSGTRRPPLRGTVRKNVCQATSDGAWPALQALESFTAQVANAERDALVFGTSQMAPQFDMTKSGEGLRYMTTLLTRMGLGYLAKAAPQAIRSIATGKPVQLPNPIASWTPGVGGSQNLPTPGTNPPSALNFPAVVLNTPRPLQVQEEIASCGLACVKMVVDTILRTPLPESFYRNLAMGPNGQYDASCYLPGSGSYTTWLRKILGSAGIPTNLQYGQSIAQLNAATRNGYPAIALLAGGQDAAGHFVVVDGFASDAANNWYVFGRDPLNLNLLDSMTQSLFTDTGFKNYFVRPITEFEANWSGEAVYSSQ